MEKALDMFSVVSESLWREENDQLLQRVQDLEVNQQVLLKQLQSEKHHVIIEIQTPTVSGSFQEKGRVWMEERDTLRGEKEVLLQRVQDLEETEKVLVKLLQSEEHHLIIEIETPTVSGSLQEKDVLLQRVHDLEENEKVLLKLLQSEKHHLIIEVDAPMVSGSLQEKEVLLQRVQDLEENEKVLLKLLQSEKHHLIVEIERTPVVEGTQGFSQREKWWVEKWQERENLWLAAVQVREQQWAQVQSENLKNWTEWKSQYEQQVLDLENSVKEAELNQQLLLNLLETDKHHLVVEIEKTSDTLTPETEIPQMLVEEAEVKDAHSMVNASSNCNLDNLVTFGEFPQGFKYLDDPSGAAVEMVPLKRAKAFPKAEAALTSKIPSTNITEVKMWKTQAKKDNVGVQEVLNVANCHDNDNLVTFGDFSQGFEFLFDPAIIRCGKIEAKDACDEPNPSHSNNNDNLITFGDFPQGFEFLNDPSGVAVEMVPPKLAKGQCEAAVTSKIPITKTTKRKMRKTQAKKQNVGVKDVHDVANCHSNNLITFGDFSQGIEFLFDPAIRSCGKIEAKDACDEPKPSHSNDNDNLITFGDFPQGFEYLNDPSGAAVEMAPLNHPKAQSEAVSTSEMPSTKITNGKMKKMQAKKQNVRVKYVHNVAKSQIKENPSLITFGDFPKDWSFFLILRS